MLNLTDFAREVHAVAVEHGWWEGEENNDIDTKIALIHAEWSEALEEYRAGRPMVWHECAWDGKPCDEGSECDHFVGSDCDVGERCEKPEGIAVELVDGCIRIMDLVEAIKPGKYGWEALRSSLYAVDTKEDCTFGGFIALLHGFISAAVVDDNKVVMLIMAASFALKWIADQGIDPWELLQIKHEYNKTRSYRHGGKRC